MNITTTVEMLSITMIWKLYCCFYDAHHINMYKYHNWKILVKPFSVSEFKWNLNPIICYFVAKVYFILCILSMRYSVRSRAICKSHPCLIAEVVYIFCTRFCFHYKWELHSDNDLYDVISLCFQFAFQTLSQCARLSSSLPLLFHKQKQVQ